MRNRQLMLNGHFRRSLILKIKKAGPCDVTQPISFDQSKIVIYIPHSFAKRLSIQYGGIIFYCVKFLIIVEFTETICVFCVYLE